MSNEIKTIEFKMYGGLPNVNCYLVKTDVGFILIDTGPSNKRTEIEKGLRSVECNPGDHKLILITRGDSDHTGNAFTFEKNMMQKIPCTMMIREWLNLETCHLIEKPIL